MSWIAETGQLLTAAGVGSILGSLVTQFVSRSGERRALRAKVREELSQVEQLRWAKADPPGVRRSPTSAAVLRQQRADELAAARLRLHTAAMMAHLPKEFVELYDQLAMAAFTSSKESLEHGDELAGVPRAVNERVTAAYELICDRLWHPVLTRLTHRRRFKQLQKLMAKNRETPVGVNLRGAYDQT